MKLRGYGGCQTIGYSVAEYRNSLTYFERFNKIWGWKSRVWSLSIIYYEN